MVGPNVPERIKTQQLVWNLQSQTPTTLRMLKGARPLTSGQWYDIVAPVLVIVGEMVNHTLKVADDRIKYVHPQMDTKSEQTYQMKEHQICSSSHQQVTQL
jgi:hypothetical protein